MWAYPSSHRLSMGASSTKSRLRVNSHRQAMGECCERTVRVLGSPPSVQLADGGYFFEDSPPFKGGVAAPIITTAPVPCGAAGVVSNTNKIRCASRAHKEATRPLLTTPPSRSNVSLA